jgi:hypothetical protein
VQQESNLKDDKTQTVIGRQEDFDRTSGNFAERAIFNHRPLVVLLCLLVTLVLGWQATRIGINASYEKTIPTGHPYVANFLENRRVERPGQLAAHRRGDQAGQYLHQGLPRHPGQAQ